jgi:hypothetical protein
MKNGISAGCRLGPATGCAFRLDATMILLFPAMGR